jgi:hypothetical protein
VNFSSGQKILDNVFPAMYVMAVVYQTQRLQTNVLEAKQLFNPLNPLTKEETKQCHHQTSFTSGMWAIGAFISGKNMSSPRLKRRAKTWRF